MHWSVSIHCRCKATCSYTYIYEEITLHNPVTRWLSIFLKIYKGERFPSLPKAITVNEYKTELSVYLEQLQKYKCEDKTPRSYNKTTKFMTKKA